MWHVCMYMIYYIQKHRERFLYIAIMKGLMLSTVLASRFQTSLSNSKFKSTTVGDQQMTMYHV